MKPKYSVGVDVGSTTVKCVVLDECGEIVHSVYGRHYSKVKETVFEQLKKIFSFFDGEFKVAMPVSVFPKPPAFRSCRKSIRLRWQSKRLIPTPIALWS